MDVQFALTFATKQAEVDAVVWVAYSKGTSKNYKCEFNRDNGFDTVRMVAIDDDWCALRFRRTEFIKK